MKRPRWIKSGASVTWDELIDWAKAHGAQSDLIQSVTIGGIGQRYPSVCIEGVTRDCRGRPFVGVDGDVARWKVDTILRYLP